MLWLGICVVYCTFDGLFVHSFFHLKQAFGSPFLSALPKSSSYDSSYLERLVDRKKIEVNTLLRQHQDTDDPLVMRMSYMSSECKYNITRSIRKGNDDDDGNHASVLKQAL